MRTIDYGPSQQLKKKFHIFTFKETFAEPSFKGCKGVIYVLGLENTSFHQDQTPERETYVDCILSPVKGPCR